MILPPVEKRTPYNDEVHCGAPVDRSIERYLEKEAKLAGELAELEKQGELSYTARGRGAFKQRQLAMIRDVIHRLNRDGADDRPCMLRKGFKTTHPGVGHCSKHCDCRGKRDFHITNQHTYSRRNHRTKLSGLIDHMAAANHDLTDLAPELYALKAKVQIFIEEKDDCDPETIRSLALLQEQIRKTVETINNKKFQASITKETFDVIMYRMGEVLMKYISDEDILQQIALDWQKIAVDTTPKRKALSRGSIAVEAREV